MKKLSLICGSIAVLCGGAANAGTLTAATSGGIPFAAEMFSASASFAATDDIVPAVATYTVGTTNGIVVNPGGTLYFTVRLAGGTFKAAPLAGSLTGTALNVGGANNGVPAAAVLSSDKTTATWAVTFTAAATLGVGSTFVYTPPALGAATSIVGVKSALATVGGKVTATASMSAITPVVVAPSTTTAPNTGTAQASDIDGPIGSADLAVSVQGIATAISNLPGYTGRIDLTASTPGNNYALLATPGTAVVAKLGSVTFTDRTTAGNSYNGTTAVTVAAAKTASSTTIQVTPGAGQAFPVGSVLSVSSAGDQCVTQVGALAAFTAVTSTAAATLTVPAANTISGTPIEICLSKPSGTNVASPITASIVGTLSVVAIDAKGGSTTATGNGYSLILNGSQVDVATYYPNALSAFGYGSYFRIVNTGTVPAVISGSFVPTTGGAGGSYPVSSSVPAGGAVTLTGAQIEAILGAPTSSDRPRLRLSAPTNSMQVQYFLQNPNGTIVEISNRVIQ